MKKKYHFNKVLEGYVPIVVEAESEEEAERLAEEADFDPKDIEYTNTLVQDVWCE